MTHHTEADQALKKLIDGNKRFASLKQKHPNQGVRRRSEVSKGQKPFAVIVGCSDSRIPPEILFDQGIGDIFVIRDAGNIVDDVVLGSIEYAVDHLGTRLVVILGHSKCGAVTATVQGGEAHGHVGSIVKAIIPAVRKAKGKKGDLIDNAIRANIDIVTKQVKSSTPVIAKLVRTGKVKVVGAYYDIDTGLVQIL
ncbi:MAG TPA: carbonic anhydrase [Syntrophorhabdaceae bacterium]|nr:carbonic anhydrase [Syntrophorhabdaceae bacterium]HQM81287.1 carbonic anhydrase [Syntrophorhabdaceae bacterium]